MAMQIGQVQGNYHLQRVIQTAAGNGKVHTNGHNGNGNGHSPNELSPDEPIEDFENPGESEPLSLAIGPPDNPNRNNGKSNLHTGLLIQRKPSEYEHPEDGGAVEQRMQQHIREAEEEGEEPEEGTSPEEAAKNIDRRQVAAKKGEVREDSEPDVDRPAEEKSLVEQNAQETKKATEEAAKPLAEGEGKKPPEGKQTGDQAAGVAEQAAALAEQAFAQAESQPEPEAPPTDMPAPEPITPVDAEGGPLPGNPGAEAEVANLAQQAQSLAIGGHGLRQQATLQRANAMTMQGNIGLVMKGIGQSEQGVQKSTVHLEFRQGLVEQAKSALELSEQKADMVAKEAPEYAAKSDEGKEESGPMVTEAGEMAGENAANAPDDEEAAGDSQEQGEKINKVGSDASNMDDAIAQTKERAGSLGEEATQAKETNAQSGEKINSAKETLDQTQGRLDQMNQQNVQSRGQVEALASQPEEMIMQANDLDQQGQTLIQSSGEIIQRLTQVQADYQAGMSSVPAIAEAEGVGEAGPPIQMQPVEESVGQATAVAEGPGPEEAQPEAPTEEPAEFSSDGQGPGGDGRTEIDLAGGLQESLPSWATGAEEPSQEKRQQAIQEQEERRAQQLQEINEAAGGDFESLSAGEKMGLALEMTGQNLFGSVSEIEWPGWGKLAAGLIDPRGPMMGVVGGLSKMLSGAANLFSAEQWARDPLGNLLKSAADIATGLTIVLGSITALAGVIIAIMTAITVLSFGFAAPVTGPIIAFCATVLTTVGGWTIAVGKIALILQALVLIKNLIDAATAKNAQELLSESEQMTENVKDAGGVVLQMGMAKLGQIGGRGLKAQIAEAGGAKAFARAIPGKMVSSARALPGRVAGGVRAVGRGITGGARAVGRGARAVGRGARSLGKGVKQSWQRLKGRFGRNRAKSFPNQDVIAEHPTAQGHKIQVVRGGRILHCSACDDIEKVFKETLDQNPPLRARFDDIARRSKLADKLDEQANITGDPKLRSQADKLAKEVAADAARIEQQLVKRGILRNGQRFKPEPELLGDNVHGLDWTGGPKRLTDSPVRTPQGQFGSAADIQFAVEKGAELGVGKEGWFNLPSGNKSFVWKLEDGKIIKAPANRIYVKVRGSGNVHAYPAE
jgi:hypothetical protein